MKNVEEYEQSYFSWLSDNAICSSCGEFEVKPDNVWFDDSGYGYSTRLTKCPHCGKIVILKHIEDYGLDVNFDNRFYSYK